MTHEERKAKAERASFEYYRNAANVSEASRAAGISPATFDRWHARGIIRNPEPDKPIVRASAPPTRSGSTRGRYL